MKLTKDSPLASLRIPHLPMVVREAFAVYIQGEDSGEACLSWTVGDLADRAHQPIETVINRLLQIEGISNNVEIGCAELKEKLSNGDHGKELFLLDVRQSWEFAICHLPRSNLMANLELAELIPTLNDLEVITICHHGVRSLSAAFYLREAGLPIVRSLRGGLDEWAVSIDKSMRRY